MKTEQKLDLGQTQIKLEDLENLGFSLVLNSNSIPEDIRKPILIATGPSPDELEIQIAHNLSAADTINADQLWSGGSLGLNLTGQGITVGVWDQGKILNTHQELNGRVVFKDTASWLSDHSTHVAGTIAGTGSIANARGMANQLQIHGYDQDNDYAELVAAAQNLNLTNHSYGNINGWTNLIDWGIGPVDTWYVDYSLSSTEDPSFGKYAPSDFYSNVDPRALDEILYNNPQLLSVWASGIDRSDQFQNLQANNTFVTYLSNGFYGAGWYIVYGTIPGKDGNAGTGYDSISAEQVAKNNLVVGAIDDQTADPYSNVIMTNFSGWGPTDDGRVKPDVVANGVDVYSSMAFANTAYGNITGTSSAAASTTGTLALLYEHYKNLFATTPYSATMKGLVIHTAFDAGNIGPDYQYGWGVVNGAAAANFLTDVNAHPSSLLQENTYTGSEQTFTVVSDGTEPLKVTVVWTDPPGQNHNELLDDSTPVLVNDLDLWVTDSNNKIYYPWTLNPANPNLPAVQTTANHLDNIEQVLINTPGAGTYTVHIGHTGTVSNQKYSLLLSGGDEHQNFPPTDIILTPLQINENLPALTVVGNFTTEDANPEDSHTYTLVTGSGSTDNNFFTISGNQLKTAASFDFETKNSYSIRVQTNDGNGGTLEEIFTIQVNDLNEPQLVKDIRSGSNNSTPNNLTNVNNILYFSANNGTDGVELWKSDGTAAGTVLVKDIRLGSGSSTPTNLINVNNTLLFQANNGINGIELLKSDGTATGTVLVKDIRLDTSSSLPNKLTNVNNILYFSANNGTNGIELWKSDGTSTGTVLVKDIFSGNSSSNSNPNKLTNVNNILYFQAYDNINGYELWKSDGTTAGTVLVKDIRPGSNSSTPSSLINFNNTLYFSANNGSNGVELWKSDGTATGTVLVKDIRSGSGSSTPTNLANVNNILYFQATDGTLGNELWKSDGTAAGTVLIKDIFPGSSSSFPSSLININGTLYFSANNGTNGVELWKSDGTAPGTVLVKDIFSGSGSSKPSNLININGTLYFSANDGINGVELWQSDGTAAGTFLVKDIRSGSGSSNPNNLININNNLYFQANDGISGNELWKFTPTSNMSLSVDTLTGAKTYTGVNAKRDIFLLENDFDSSDYAVINNFNLQEDLIQLYGSIQDYTLSGENLFFDNDLIAIISGVSDLNLTKNYFEFI